MKNSNTADAGGTYNPFIDNSSNIYQKVKYQDGKWISGHDNGVDYGNSLLILNYKAQIQIGIDGKDSTSGSITYNLNNGEGEVIYRLKNIKTEVENEIGAGENRPTTNLTIKTVLDEDHADAVKNGTHQADVQCLTISSGSYQIEGYLVTDGVAASEKTAIAISDNKDTPTVLEYVGSDGERYRISIYAQRSAAEITFEISGAPIGIALPDIAFNANFAQSTLLENNATFTTRTYISGSGDCRAYDETHGNMAGITVQAAITGGTAMNKVVSDSYIELDEDFTYTVSYTNGDEPQSVAYFYDLLPMNGDSHGSAFEGELNYADLRWTLTDGDGNAITPDGASVTLYYSINRYTELSSKLTNNCFGKDQNAVEVLLDGEGGTDTSKPFKLLTGLQEGDKEDITGVFLKVTNLPANSVFTFKLKVDTEDSEAGGVYKNVAYAWATETSVGTQTSPRVETNVISRKISGVVWWDKDLDGIRDTDESLLSGVTATLFQKQSNGSYAVCAKDVTGAAIDGTTTTDENGAYAFNKLAEGEYIVAFSGDALGAYNGATDYQTDGGSSVSNDGVAISKLSASGIDTSHYAYAIQYSTSFSTITLHSLTEIATSVTLNGGVEDIDHQDLGVVVTGPELPMTGGIGAIPYTVGGLLLMGVALCLLYYKRKCGQTDTASR